MRRRRWTRRSYARLGFGSRLRPPVRSVAPNSGSQQEEERCKQTFVLAAATLAIPLIDTSLGWLDQTLFANKALKPH